MIIFKILQNRRLRRSQASLDKNLAPGAPNSPRYCCEVRGSRQHESDVVVSSCSESKIPRRPPTVIIGFERNTPASRGQESRPTTETTPRPGTQVPRVPGLGVRPFLSLWEHFSPVLPVHGGPHLHGSSGAILRILAAPCLCIGQR